MAADNSAPILPSDLEQAQSRILELEAQLRAARSHPGAPVLQEPSSILESISDAFVAVDAEFRYVWVNAEAERLHGMSRYRMLGRCMWDVFPELKDNPLYAFLHRALAEQASAELENHFAPTNRWFFNKVYPTRDGGLALYSHEITAQKRAQADLARQNAVLEQVYDAIIRTDLNGRITRWNQGATQVFGYHPEEAVGQPLTTLFFEADRGAVKSQILGPLLNQGELELELRNRCSSGDECYIRLCATLLRDENGTPYGTLCVAINITAQKHAEQGLRASEERYRSLVNALPQIAYLTDAQGQTQMVNRYWEDYSGVPCGQCVGLDWTRWLHPDDIAAHQAKWLRSLASSETFEHEARFRNRGGEFRWHLVRGVPVHNSERHITQWVGTATEIHARKQAEEALRDSEERFRLAFQAVQGAVYDWYPQTGKVVRSAGIRSILGIAAEETEPTQSWWQDRIHPDDQAVTGARILQQLPKDQNQYETEFRILHADGHWVHVADRGFIIRDENGIPVRVVGSSQDVTENRQLERELKEINLQLRFQAEILATTDDAVFALDSSQLIRYCNAGAERMYGIKTGEVIGKPLTAIHGNSLVTPEAEPHAMADLARHGSWTGENTHIGRNGVEILVSSTVNTLSTESGGGLVAIIRDISNQKRADLEMQDQLKRHALQLTRANEDLLHFAYAVSHDLQSPLRTVKSFAQLLALKYKAKLDDQAGDFIRLIVDGASRMDTMLHDLLQFAKVAGGEAEFHDQVSLEEAVSNAIQNLRSGIEETHAVITHDPVPTVAGDAGQFAQLFQNLIGNSLKYRSPDVAPRIHISAEQTPGEWVITVSDNGIGFEPAYAEKIFGVFQRLHSSEFAGTGIGLSICKRIVERRGGRIWAAAQPGRGATFSFSIPSNGTVAQVGSQPFQLAQLDLNGSFNGLPPDKTSPAPSHFDELFHTLALAQAVVRNMAGDIVIWTQGSERLFGYSQQEAVGRSLHALIQTESAITLQEIETALLRDGEWTGELKARKRDGSTVWLATHKALYRDGSGRPKSVIEVHNDITALKEAQAALSRSSQQRDLAFDAARIGVWQWDLRANRIEWSRTLEQLLGMQPGSFDGSFESFQERLHPDDRHPLQEQIARAFNNGPGYSIENRLRHSDGHYLWVRGQGRVLTDDCDEPAGLIGVVWSIHELKQQEADRQFLLDVSAKISESSGEDQLAEFVTTALGRHLNLSLCRYAEIDASGKQVRAVAEFTAGDHTSLATYPVDRFGDLLRELAANQSLTLTDTKTDPRTAHQYARVYQPLGIRACLAVPFFQQGLWRAMLTAVDDKPRMWKESEITLMQAVAHRLWPALENARLLHQTSERQEQFESTFEQAAVGMAHVSPDGNWLRVNQRICGITGYDKDELLGSRFQEITHPDDLEHDLRQFEQLIRGEIQSYSMEKRYFHKLGHLVWINLTVSLLKHADGRPKYSISVIEDISARRKTSEQLAATNALAALRLREIESIYSQAPVGLFFLDAALRFVRVNHCFSQMTGVPVARQIGQTVSHVLPEPGEWLESALRNVIESRKPITEKELRLRTTANPDIQSTWLVNFYPLEAPDGTVLGLNGVVQDITERKQTETAYVDAAERLRIATSAAKLGVYVWDVPGDRGYFENDQVYRILGRDPRLGPVSQSEFFHKIILAEDAASHSQAMQKAIERGEPFHSIFRFHRGDGQVRWAETHGQLEFDAKGELLRLTGVVADATERIEAEDLLRNQKQHLSRVLDSLFVFVGVMSLEGVLLDVNRAPLSAAGISVADVLGKSFGDCPWWSHSAQARGSMLSAIEKARRGEMSRFDIQARVGKEQYITLDFMLSPLRDDQGVIKFLVPSAVPIDERKQAEEALRRSEERYLMAEWATNDGLWDWNPTTDYCHFSPRFKALLHFEDHEMQNTGAAVFSRLHTESEPVLFEALRLHFEEDQPYDVEVRVQLKDSSYHWFRTRGKAVRDADGKVVRMVGSMSDVEHRKEAEVRAREQEEQWRRMIDSIEQLAWIAEADGSIFFFNQRWYEYTGKTPEEMQGWGWQSVHDPNALPAVLEHWTAALLTQEPFEMEFPLRGKDGIYRPFLTRAMPVRDSAKKVVRWFGTNTNVESLRREQDLLKESERKFRELAETIPEQVWAADPDGKVTYWNSTMYEYTGYSPEQSLGDGWLSLLHPEDAPRLRREWQISIASLRHHESETRLRRHDGVYRWFLHRAEAIRDEAGKVTRWLGTSTDIHERKITEQALRRSNEDLEQFAFAASHDLQEPLRTVAIFSQLLARRYGGHSDEASRFARNIVNGTARMDHLLKGILEYSRVGDAIEDWPSCSSEEMLNAALHNLQEAIAESKAVINHHPLPVVACPDTHVVQLFQNVIGNAIKYRSKRPLQIEISAARKGNFYEFLVSDNGIGIKPEYAQQIFGIFRRLHREEYPGIGVGLAICKRIVERAGGSIWVQSDLDVGTTFCFTLPAIDV